MTRLIAMELTHSILHATARVQSVVHVKTVLLISPGGDRLTGVRVADRPVRSRGGSGSSAAGQVIGKSTTDERVSMRRTDDSRRAALRAVALGPCLLAAAAGCVAGDVPAAGEKTSDVRRGAGTRQDRGEEEIPFAAAKLLIEHNATAGDTGFQGFVDGEPWRRFEIIAPDGRPVLSVKPRRELARLGLTELFFETQEPANDEVPIAEVLALLPPGEYEFEGQTIDGVELEASATLTHTLPAGPTILSPAEGAIVDPDQLVVSWRPVTRTLDGSSDVHIVGYQLIVEKDEEPPFPQSFAGNLFSVHVMAETTSVTVSKEFLDPGSAYKVEVLAIEESGNQTITESTFHTR